jgi:phosphoribosylanthranilate isomerase
MIVKICGITNQQDADAAVEGGANAIGFNFYPRSPRHIAPERAAGIETPDGIRRVGVFVNEPRARIEEIARIARLGVAQLHGKERPSEYPKGLTVWKAVRVTEGLDLRKWLAALATVQVDPVSKKYGFALSNALGGPAEAFLLDGPAGALYGGAGRAFDWSVLQHMPRVRAIVAGGLDATNVAKAVSLAHPWGVDACSRIESGPGKKDHKKMLEFLTAARAALGA